MEVERVEHLVSGDFVVSVVSDTMSIQHYTIDLGPTRQSHFRSLYSYSVTGVTPPKIVR